MTIKNQKKSIDTILTVGLRKPKSMRVKMIDLVHSLGWRNIFWDTGYGLFLSVMTLLIVGSVFFFIPAEFHFTTITISVPLIYLLTLFLVEMSERINGLYELKQSFHYNILQITAIRLLFYALIGFIFSSTLIFILHGNQREFVQLFCLCLMTLALCVALSLAISRRFRGKWSFGFFSLGWLIMNLLLLIVLDFRYWETQLRSLPIYIVLIGSIVSCSFAFYQLNKIFSEVNSNVIVE